MASVSPAQDIGIAPAACPPRDPLGLRRRLAALFLVLGMHGAGLGLALHLRARLPAAAPSRVLQVSWLEADDPASGAGEAASAAQPAGTRASSSSPEPPKSAVPPAASRPRPALEAAPAIREISRRPAPSLPGKTRLRKAGSSVQSSPAAPARPAPAEGGGVSAGAEARSGTVPAVRDRPGDAAAPQEGAAGSGGSAAPSGAAPAGGRGAASGGAPAFSAPRFDAAYLSNPAPEYPPVSREMGEEGRVFLRVQVSAEGRPLDLRVHRGSGYDRLDRAALEAVRRWRFVPGRLGSQAVAAQVIVPIHFYLR